MRYTNKFLYLFRRTEYEIQLKVLAFLFAYEEFDDCALAHFKPCTFLYSSKYSPLWWLAINCWSILWLHLSCRL